MRQRWLRRSWRLVLELRVDSTTRPIHDPARAPNRPVPIAPAPSPPMAPHSTPADPPTSVPINPPFTGTPPPIDDPSIIHFAHPEDNTSSGGAHHARPPVACGDGGSPAFPPTAVPNTAEQTRAGATVDAAEGPEEAQRYTRMFWARRRRRARHGRAEQISDPDADKRFAREAGYPVLRRTGGRLRNCAVLDHLSKRPSEDGGRVLHVHVAGSERPSRHVVARPGGIRRGTPLLYGALVDWRGRRVRDRPTCAAPAVTCVLGGHGGEDLSWTARFRRDERPGGC